MTAYDIGYFTSRTLLFYHNILTIHMHRHNERNKQSKARETDIVELK